MRSSIEESYSGNYFLKLNSTVPEGRREWGPGMLGWGGGVVGDLMGKPFCFNCIVHIKLTTTGAKAGGGEVGGGRVETWLE